MAEICELERAGLSGCRGGIVLWAGHSAGSDANDTHKEPCDASKQDGRDVQSDFAAGFLQEWVQGEDYDAPTAAALAASRDFAEASLRAAHRTDSGGARARRILLRQSERQMGRGHTGIAASLPGGERAGSNGEVGCADLAENGIGFGCGRRKRAAGSHAGQFFAVI
jgi:hypothetical protein